MPTPEELLEKLEERLIMGEISEKNYEELKARLLAKTGTSSAPTQIKESAPNGQVGDVVMGREAKMHIDHSQTIYYGDDPNAKKQATQQGEHCPICGGLVRDDYFFCKRCNRNYIHLNHRDQETYFCSVCVQDIQDENKRKNIESLFFEANEKVNKNSFEDAIKTFEKILTIEDSEDARKGIANCKKTLLRIEDERIEAEKMRKVESFLFEANEKMNKNYFEDAIKIFEKVLTIEINSEAELGITKCKNELLRIKEEEKRKKIDSLISEGNQLVAQEKYNDAINKFKEVLSIDNNERARNSIGLCEDQILKIEEERKKKEEKLRKEKEQKEKEEKRQEEERLKAEKEKHKKEVEDLLGEMIFIEGGSFSMGNEDDRTLLFWENTEPVHTVKVNSFKIGKYPITFEQYDFFCKETRNPKPTDYSKIRGKKPVKGVKWNDAVKFCEWASQITQKKYRLPTEAEWEYAARGGQKSRGFKYSGSDILEEVGWYEDSEKAEGDPFVGKKKPNELGIYDMSGLIEEACQDKYDKEYYFDSPVLNPLGPSKGSERVYRGGCIYSSASRCQVASRRDYVVDAGFRIVEELSEVEEQICGQEGIKEVQGKITEEEIKNKVSISADSKLFEEIRNDMMFVEGGIFRMGSRKIADEKPIHEVRLDSFEICKYPVTFKQYDKYCEDTGVRKTKSRGWGRGRHPVLNVSWEDALKFCEWLAAKTGKKYRLPTEAEWEYAASGGNKSSGYKFSGSKKIEEVAWYYIKKKKEGFGLHPVGEKKPNELGLYDMSGNVWEWCHDFYNNYTKDSVNNPKGPSSGSRRVMRGGSFASEANICRVTARGRFYPEKSGGDIGFRLAMDTE